MPGCCLAAALLFVGPRVVLLFAWLLSDWYDAFDSSLVALLGWALLPWTSLAWMFTYFANSGELRGGYIVLLILGVLADLGAFGGGGAAASRQREG